jgi:hypothetical protein
MPDIRVSLERGLEEKRPVFQLEHFVVAVLYVQRV